MDPAAPSLELALTETPILSLSGNWEARELPDSSAILAQIAALKSHTLELNLEALQGWDSRLSALLLKLERLAAARSCTLKLREAPEPLRQILALATSVPRHEAPGKTHGRLFSMRLLRRQLGQIGDEFLQSLEFLGDALLAISRTLLGRGAMRRSDLLDSCFQAGPDALGIITLTSVLVGMILAYLGAAQLLQFGAAVYVADLVAIGMLREMGALMTAIVMAGRTGAAYAAQLSSMQGNEEIDAISTLGIDPMEFLVAPRIIALLCMMPLLVVFSDALGILGGAIVAGSMGVTPLQYVSQLHSAVSFTHFSIGLVKAVIFALLIALAGCRAGMAAGRNSAAVGQATTEAVVTSVVYLIIADAAINILCQQLGI